MAFGLTIDGFVLKRAEDLKEALDTYQRAYIDPGLVLSPTSLRGSQNDAMVTQLAELWELGQAVYSSQYPDSANGASLDQAVALTGTRRNVNTKTLVTGQVTLNPDKELPVGSVAHLTGQPNQRFITTESVPANPAGGTFDVVFEAETAGAVQVASGQLSVISESVSGWTAVTNADAGATGNAREEDDELRLRQQNELRASGSTNTIAIRSGLLQVADVSDCIVFENVTGHAVGGLKPHSVRAVVRGGVSEEIAAKLFEKKAAGIDTNGAQSNVITDSEDQEHTILHDLATEGVFYATFAVTVDSSFDPVLGPEEIKTEVKDYIDGVNIGRKILYDECKYAAYSVVGVYEVTSLSIGLTTPPSSTGNLVVGPEVFTTCDIANVLVTVNL